MDFSRQEMVGEIGVSGQRMISESSVAVVGLGGIGCFSSQLLLRAGVKNLVIIDRDVVDDSNLYRQVLFSERDVGRSKAFQAVKALRRLSSDARVDSFAVDLDKGNVGILRQDVVLDCTDNFEARFLINEFCRKNKVPWVYSSALGVCGYVASFVGSGACFRCIFSESNSSETCDSVGVANYVAAAIASFQVGEAIKVLLGKKSKGMIKLDMWDNEFVKIRIKKSASCPVCNGRYEYLEGVRGSSAVKLCGKDTYQIKGGGINFSKLKESLPSFLDFGGCIRVGDVTVFSDGRALVSAGSEASARAKYSRLVG